MKASLFFSALWLAIASFFAPANKAVLTGTVTGESAEKLVGANVTVLKNRTTVVGAITDTEGKYKIEVEPGIYDVQVSYVGYATKRLTDIKIEAGKANALHVVLEAGAVLSEVVVTEIKDRSDGEADMAMTYDAMGSARKTRAKSSAPAMTKAPAGKGDAAAGKAPAKAATRPLAPTEPKPVPATSEPSDIAVGADGRKKHAEVAFDLETYEEEPAMLIDEKDGKIYEGEAKEMPDAAATGTLKQPKPRAGLLTAGEWNDLHNWNHHWTDLQADGEIGSYENMYGFFAQQRYTVMLSNQDDIPMADMVVQLKNAGEMLWEARTDNTGKAELWAGLYDKKTYSNLSVEVWVNGKKQELKTPKTAKEGFNFLKVNTPCAAPTNVDIVWAVDATGSMGDELEYLKTEVLDVIGRAKNNNPALNFRMGTAFYRDKGDEYIVKSSGLSTDIARTVEFIQKQSAGGGGDYPEAVHSALEEVVYGQKWNENAIARICFLVLDASPHKDPAVIASLQKSIREAARLGIRIVPLAASGIQKDTEFLMKFFGLATNGTYLFLTDHSGIGGKHLEPTTDEYKVEPLNDLLVRIITEYTSIKTCEGKSNIRFEDDPQQQPGAVIQASYYPNPAVDQFTLELPYEVQSVALYDSEGKGVRKLEKPQAGPNIIRISDLAAGFYTIRIMNNGRMQSGKLLVIRA
jgi:Carboxypeptidase regulatory-like domain/Secretion system C-terminal sorting domain